MTRPNDGDGELLDLVEQCSEECYQQGIAAGHYDEGSEDHYDEKARTLLARIAALIPRQPVQARDRNGEPLWIHVCGKIVAWKPDVPPPDWVCDDDTGSWLPLLVAPDGAPAPRNSRGLMVSRFPRVAGSDTVDLAEAVDAAPDGAPVRGASATRPAPKSSGSRTSGPQC